MKKILSSLAALTLFFSMSYSVFAEPDNVIEETTATEIPIVTTEVPPWITQPPPDWINNKEYEKTDLMGNAELVESQHMIFESNLISFFAVTTKAGNVFYIFIDHRIEDGSSNVYFLNKVDEMDLISLLYDPNEKDEDGNPVNHSLIGQQPVTTTVTVEDDTAVPVNAEPKETEKKKPLIPMTNIIIVAVVFVAGIGIMIFTRKGGKKQKHRPIEEDYNDDEPLEDSFDPDDE